MSRVKRTQIDSGSRRSLLARSLRAGAGFALGGSMAACSSMDTLTSWIPWSSSKPKLPSLPELGAGNSLLMLWRTSVDELGQGFAPAMLDDLLVVATRSGRLTAFDPMSGERRFEHRYRKGFSTGVAGHEGMLLVAGSDGFLLAMSRDGTTRWSTYLGAEVVSVPATGSGIAVVRTSDNRIQALDLERGQVRWSIARQSPPLVLRATNAAVIRDEVVFMGLPGGRMMAVNSANGQILWESVVSSPRGTTEIERLSDVLGQPIVDGAEVLAASFQGKLTSFDRSSGQLRWSRDVGAVGAIAADSVQVIAADDRGQVQSFSRSGAPQWKQEALRGRRLSAPALSQRLALVADEEGVLHGLGREQGQLLGRLSVGSKSIACAPWIDGTLGWTISSDGSVCGFRMAHA
ncbi:MAG: outer membrane protein assembly factor BamB [Betaproteobacteria bacterium]|nr:outer membrane protein assembly factor BamB [Betaproteobacteria bacterium]